MNEKDLVLNEPISTGWAHKQFSGDEEKAKAYMTIARGMIGTVRTIHGVNERIASGEPGGYYHMQRELPDGTLIEVFTNDGHDSMRITATSQTSAATASTESHEETVTAESSAATSREGASEVARKRVTESLKVEYPGVLICGSCDDGTNLHPTVWGFAKYPIDLGNLKDCTTGEALSISSDGTVVVGYSRGAGGTQAFRWDESNGMRALGPVGDDNYAIATDVSDDGSVICGISRNGDNSFNAWRWTEPKGFEILPDLGLGVPDISVPTTSIRVNLLRYDVSPSISPNGRYVVGTVLRRDPQQVYVGAVWVDGDLFEIPVPGTITTPYGIQIDGDPAAVQPGLSGPLWSGDQSMPVSVTDDGLVVGYSTHLDMVETIFHIDYDHGISPPDQHPLLFNPLSPQTAFMWNVGTPACTFVADGDAAAIANDSQTIAGNSNSGPLMTRVLVQHITPTDGVTIVTTTYQIYDSNTPNGWYLDGLNQVVSLGDWTSAYDVSDDGEVIVGSVQNDTNSLPAMWDLGREKAKLTLLDLIPGATRGWATSVATNTTEIDLWKIEHDV